MKRHIITPRKDWQKIVESQGLTFHSRTVPYWNEEACYEFTSKEIDELEKAGNDVHEICLEAADYIINKNLFHKLAIPQGAAELIKKSWNNDELHVYGRFDFAYDGKTPPKMLEYNADTPTSLLEASVIQWFWMKNKYPDADQFNSIHEKLIDRWKELNLDGKVYFSTLDGVEEDNLTVEYLRDTALQSGLNTQYINLEDVGLEKSHSYFVDLDNKDIKTIFKLYPWEWMIHEEFGEDLHVNKTRFIEPAWKMLWSNKGILPILSEIAPNHPNILYSSNKPLTDRAYVKKPIFSREGANVTIVNGVNGGEVAASLGDYGEEGYIYQEYARLPEFDGKHPVLGIWMIGDDCSGMGIRESPGLITDNLSRFTPHYFR